MKVAVYTIAKDESQFVKRFMKSCKDADLILIGVDIRTTDDTKKKLQFYGAKTIDIDINPWRFDSARNLVLEAIPSDFDVCISLDLDEVLLDGWRKQLEKQWNNNISMLRYIYIYDWSDPEQTIPSITSLGYKIHGRHDYTWQNAVHENLKYISTKKSELIVISNTIQINHYPDIIKDRTYNSILDRVVQEEPNNAWMSHVRARELFLYKRYEEAIEESKRYLNLSKAYQSNEEGQTRAETMRIIARSLYILHRGDPGEIQLWMLRSSAEAPNTREAWVYLGEAWVMMNNFPSAYAAFINALGIRDRTLSIECEERCWDDIYVKNMANSSLSQIQ